MFINHSPVDGGLHLKGKRACVMQWYSSMPKIFVK